MTWDHGNHLYRIGKITLILKEEVAERIIGGYNYG